MRTRLSVLAALVAGALMVAAMGASAAATGNTHTLAHAMVAKPGSYYVNVHNVKHAGGAIRAQLGKP